MKVRREDGNGTTKERGGGQNISEKIRRKGYGQTAKEA